jgi:hypothetical protein
VVAIFSKILAHDSPAGAELSPRLRRTCPLRIYPLMTQSGHCRSGLISFENWRRPRPRGDVMRRRDFIKIIAGSATMWPLATGAQQSSKKIPVVGVLWHAASAEEEEVYLSVVRKAFNDLGYIEGKNITLEQRFPAENPDRFRSLAQELVDAKPDAIIAVTVLGAVELKKLTDTIPIVFWLNFKSRASRRQYHRCHEYRSGISRQTVGDFERDRSGSIEGRYPD